MSFGRLRQRMLLQCVPHVQHDFFSSFNQSDLCFLVLSLPLPSSLLKLQGALGMTTATARKTALENKYLRNRDYSRLSHFVRIL